MNKMNIQREIYSPLQIFFGSFFLGPFAMLYFLWKNFYNMNRPVEAKKVIQYGFVFIVILTTCLQLSPAGMNQLVPGLIVPFFYALTALQISTSMQINKKEIKTSLNWAPQNIWSVLGFGLLFYLPWIGVLYAIQLL